jgi:hypothetical protein
VTDRAFGARIAVGIAALWSVGLLVAALTVPVYERVTLTASGSMESSATLVDENGGWVLMVVAIPLVVVAGIALALERRRRVGRSGAGPFAWATCVVLLLFCLITGFSIGLFVLPIALTLVAACALAS